MKHHIPGTTICQGVLGQVAHVYKISRPVVQITVTYLSTALSRNPSDYSLCLVGSGCDFQNAIFIIVFLIGNFRSSPGSAFTWISQDLTHDKTTLLQLMGWCHQWQQAITPEPEPMLNQIYVTIWRYWYQKFDHLGSPSQQRQSLPTWYLYSVIWNPQFRS